jgi:hypothetical protein
MTIQDGAPVLASGQASREGARCAPRLSSTVSHGGGAARSLHLGQLRLARCQRRRRTMCGFKTNTIKQSRREQELDQYAWRNRCAMTPSEAALWAELRGGKLGVAFTTG